MNMRRDVNGVRALARFGCQECPRHSNKLTLLEDELDTSQPRLETPNLSCMDFAHNLKVNRSLVIESSNSK